MWISARTAITLAACALLLVMVAVAAPLLPRPNLPSLPEERAAAKTGAPKPSVVKPVAQKTPVAKLAGAKFAAASLVLEAPERVRAQRMETCEPTLEGAAKWEGRAGSGPAIEPAADVVKRLVSLLRDPRTTADPRAASAEPTWVVRLVRGEQKVDVMVDVAHDRLVVVLNGETIGTYAAAGLHREFTALGTALFPDSV